MKYRDGYVWYTQCNFRTHALRVINGNVCITQVRTINVELGNTGLTQAVISLYYSVTLPTLVRGHAVRRHVPSAV